MPELCQQADPTACLNIVSSVLAILVSLLAIVPAVMAIMMGLIDAMVDFIRLIGRHYLLLLVLATVVAIGIALVAKSRPEDPRSITFHVRSSHYYAVHYEFTSVRDGGKWPGGGKVYFINRGEQHKHSLRCDPGEKICYGAWIAGDTSTYWGKGYGGRNGCADCCTFCGGQDVHFGFR